MNLRLILLLGGLAGSFLVAGCNSCQHCHTSVSSSPAPGGCSSCFTPGPSPPRHTAIPATPLPSAEMPLPGGLAPATHTPPRGPYPGVQAPPPTRGPYPGVQAPPPTPAPGTPF